jgi:hypothetical protein
MVSLRRFHVVFSAKASLIIICMAFNFGNVCSVVSCSKLAVTSRVCPSACNGIILHSGSSWYMCAAASARSTFSIDSGPGMCKEARASMREEKVKRA